MDGCWKADLGSRRPYGIHGITQRDARLQIEGQGHCRKEALVSYRERRGGRRESTESDQRNFLSAGRTHVDLPQDQRVLPEFRRHFHHHVILVERGVHGRYRTLAESVVERAVYQLRRYTETRGCRAI